MRQEVSQPVPLDHQARWWAMTALCLGMLMIGIDTTIVNVALPSIEVELRFSQASLVWVVNAYLGTFGGFLLIGGRLGDLFGHRKTFSIGIALFTLASLGCGLARTPAALIAARSAQGLAGALVTTVTLSLIATLFTELSSRARALGLITLIASGSGSAGLLIGGLLTDTLSWQWIFFINVPIGVAVDVFALSLMPHDGIRPSRPALDVTGAITVTASLMATSYGVLSGSQLGWGSTRTLVVLAVGGALLLLFVSIESQATAPLMPATLLHLPNLPIAIVAGTLFTTAMLAFFFAAALYLQFVVRLTPLQVGLAFLPSTLSSAVVSLTFVPRLLQRFPIKVPLVIGMLLVGAALALFARVPVNGSFLLDVLPAMFALGVGSGMAANPLTLSALEGVSHCQYGAAAGLVNTSRVMCSSLGLSILASIAASYTESLRATGVKLSLALTAGYHFVFLVGALFAIAGGLLSTLFIKTPK
jgi:EmrB/QacA subfamily drug resistance transporter